MIRRGLCVLAMLSNCGKRLRFLSELVWPVRSSAPWTAAMETSPTCTFGTADPQGRFQHTDVMTGVVCFSPVIATGSKSAGE